MCEGISYGQCLRSYKEKAPDRRAGRTPDSFIHSFTKFPSALLPNNFLYGTIILGPDSSTIPLQKSSKEFCFSTVQRVRADQRGLLASHNFEDHPGSWLQARGRGCRSENVCMFRSKDVKIEVTSRRFMIFLTILHFYK
jgi:hypothetical protein